MWPNRDEPTGCSATLARGAPGAVDQLLGEFREPLRRVIGLRLDPAIARRVDASDIVQDVLLEANQRLTEYLKKPDMPFHLWLRHLAQDRIIDTHRRHRLAQRRSVDREQPIARPAWADESSVSLVAQLIDTEATPTTEAIRHELQRRLSAAIDQLSEDDREIILMRHHEALSNQEVGRGAEADRGRRVDALPAGAPAAPHRARAGWTRSRPMATETRLDSSSRRAIPTAPVCVRSALAALVFALLGGAGAAMLPFGYEQLRAGKMPLGVALMVVGLFTLPLLFFSFSTLYSGIRDRIRPPLVRLTPTALYLPPTPPTPGRSRKSKTIAVSPKTSIRPRIRETIPLIAIRRVATREQDQPRQRPSGDRSRSRSHGRSSSSSA